MGSVPLARVIRSGLTESVHRGDVAVADSRGRLLLGAGDPERLVFARSSMKPLQAAVSLSLFGFDPPDHEVAVMCASHNGEPVHVEAVQALLARGGVSEAALRCPSVRPLDEDAAARAPERRSIYSDCSGKHAGMLGAAVANGWAVDSYTHPAHPLQQKVLAAVQMASGVERVDVGVDGCGVPVHALPLRAMARLFASLSAPHDLRSIGPFADRAVAAMRAEPYLVAGRNRVDTAIMDVARDVIVKSGAEGLICASLLARRMGVAIKVRDGSSRAAGPILIGVLERMAGLAGGDLDRLDPFARPAVLGGGQTVGEIVVEFELQPSA